MVYIAVSIKVKSPEQALASIKEAVSQKPDLLELRLDYMPNLDEKALDTVLDCCSLPAIATIRNKDEAGPDKEAGFKGTEEERAAYLRQAVERGAAYVDIEAVKYGEIKGYGFDKKDAKLILSYHDFEKTPGHLINMCAAFKYNLPEADIIKFAVKTNSEEDCEAVMRLLEQVDNIPLIAIGMGELGIKTRVHPKNYLTYICLSKEEASAPGQYNIEEAREELAKQ